MIKQSVTYFTYLWAYSGATPNFACAYMSVLTRRSESRLRNRPLPVMANLVISMGGFMIIGHRPEVIEDLRREAVIETKLAFLSYDQRYYCK